MPAKQTLDVKVLSLGGMVDLMCEQEAMFLLNSLGLYRNRKDLGRATPRANVSLSRAYRQPDAMAELSGSEDLLHLIAHGDSTQLQVGRAKKRVLAADVEAGGTKKKLRMPEVVVSTACEFQSDQWRAALKSCGVRLLIASGDSPSPASLTAFDMAFYSALLSTVRKGRSTLERVEESFRIAEGYYRAVQVGGEAMARFSLVAL